MKQMKINVPEGHEIDTERSDISTGEIYFREKKPEFKVGDWVFTSGNAGGWGSWPKDVNSKILEINSMDNEYVFFKGALTTHVKEIRRHATPSEIAEAKERIREKELPKRWEDVVDRNFCGYYVGFYSKAESLDWDITDKDDTEKQGYKSTWPTRQEAEASIAKAMLCQIRDEYNGCPANELDRQETHDYNYEIDGVLYESSWLVFKPHGLLEKFIREPEIKKLIEIAKPLL